MVSSLLAVASRPKFSRRLDAKSITVHDLESRVRNVAEIVELVSLVAPMLRDPDDLIVLGCAVGGRADLIVTGDRDLLVLAEFQGIAILPPSVAIRLFPPPAV